MRRLGWVCGYCGEKGNLRHYNTKHLKNRVPWAKFTPSSIQSTSLCTTCRQALHVTQPNWALLHQR